MKAALRLTASSASFCLTFLRDSRSKLDLATSPHILLSHIQLPLALPAIKDEFIDMLISVPFSEGILHLRGGRCNISTRRLGNKIVIHAA